jgi:putative tricarboxylic transport membrane protein
MMWMSSSAWRCSTRSAARCRRWRRFTPTNLFYLFIGTFLGSLVGVLPGIGPSAGMVLLLPLTFSLDPATAIIMLAGLYYGSMFGGSTTSILLNLPGESSSVMTALEGYPLTQQGRGGVALGMSAVSSFIAGTLAIIGLRFLAVPLSKLALSLGPAEECVLVFAILTLVAGLSGSWMVKGLAIGALGLVLATIGLEPLSAQTRLHFGIPALQPGISFVAAGVGLLGLPEVIETIQKPVLAALQRGAVRIRDVFPTKQDYKDSATAFPTGFLVGFVCGVLPGMGGNIGQFITHAIQKAISRKPRKLAFPVAPIILTLLLATMLETSLHRSLLISGGDWSIFVSSLFSATLVGIAALSIIVQIPFITRFLGRILHRLLGRTEIPKHGEAIRGFD